MRSWLISAVVLGFLEEYLTNNNSDAVIRFRKKIERNII